MIVLFDLCRYRDEDGEPLMDYDDDMNSDQEPQGQDHNLLDDNFDDEDEGWNRERSPTPVHDDYKSKPRKRLIKKSSAADSGADFHLRDEDEGNYGVEDENDLAGIVRDESEDGGGPSSSSGGGGAGKRKKFGKDSSGGERKKEKKRREVKGDKKFKARNMGYSGGRKSRDHEGDPEMKEMWDTLAGRDSEVCANYFLILYFYVVMLQSLRRSVLIELIGEN